MGRLLSWPALAWPAHLCHHGGDERARVAPPVPARRLGPQAARPRHRDRRALGLHAAHHLRRHRLQPRAAGHARRPPEDEGRASRRAVLLDLRRAVAGEAGREIIDEMHRLGMMVDVSHVSDPLFWDAIRYARKPVIASHSSSRALANVPRNMTDAMLKAVARNGGAVCVNYGPGFLDEDFFKAEQAIWARTRALGLGPKELFRTVRDEAARLPPVPLSKLIDHIEHMARVAGVDHVCLRSDFDGVPATPAGLEDVSKLPAITGTLA